MRITTWIHSPCIAHRGRFLIIGRGEQPPDYFISTNCPCKIREFINRARVDKGAVFLEEKYNKYIEAFLMGCSLSNVLRRMKEDGLL